MVRRAAAAFSSTTVLSTRKMRAVSARIYPVIALFCLLAFAAGAQRVPARHPSVKVLSRVQRDKILLRWAPDAAMAWRKCNKWGYTLERYTIARGGKLLPTPEKKVLLTGLKPSPLADWQALATADDNAAVIAQALYGESFKVGSGENKVARVVAVSEEQEQRFGFALYAADHNFEAAQKAALGYQDRDVRKGEKYLYRVYSLVPRAELPIDTGGVFTGLDNYEELPKPQELVGIYGNKSVMLSWNYELLRQQYNSYLVERSEDGVNYKTLSSLPVTNLNDKDGRKAASMYYADTLAVNGKQYSYRIRGINPFGETGPPSETVSGSGVELLAYVPFITHSDLQGDKKVLLQWEFDKAGEPLLQEFSVAVSDKADGFYKTVMAGILPSNRNATYVPPTPLAGSNYFTITAQPKSGKGRTSFPVLVQAIDSIPPAPPTGLEAIVYTTGLVRISWRVNKESDMLGYRLFRASQKDEEYSAVNSQILTGTEYIDTVQIQSLNKKVYYKLKATDQRFNNSDFSVPVVALKPDQLPPAAPIFTGYEVEEKGIRIKWEPSPSTDVVNHILYRSDTPDLKGAIELKSWKAGDTATTYFDENATAGRTYTYTITAVDGMDLKTSAPQPLTVSADRMANLIRPAVRGLNVYKDEKSGYMDVFWQYAEKGVIEYLVYRAEGTLPPTLWKTLQPGTYNVRDESVRSGKEYKYSVVARFEDGGQSKFSTVKTNF
ncbi:hypothetical protein IC235_15050 [Hymenobacter sp. BT664]|uniref:Fibronectin type-III domain-containing protein n=1 Tax=Hymenobacter montanus TaxID=2771359 RepID=A0A927GK54_9BACT|nr:hypothetical protein [Hymenobacter montanus]MBD2769208.1 hypothetical protein [Hymenobacter montanus]